MIDLETLSTRTNAAILSVGAALFDPVAGEIGETYYARVALESATALGHVDGGTVRWWMDQSNAARAEAFGGQESTYDALIGLVRFLRDKTDVNSLLVWAAGPTFDVIILESTFRRISIDVPWTYRAPRDVRTVLGLPGVTKPERDATLTEHNALADAIHQARCVIAAYRQLRGATPLTPISEVA
jgi:hypothetical protein